MAWGGATGQVSQQKKKKQKEEAAAAKEQKKLRRAATSGGRMTPQKRRALKKLGYKGTATGATRAKFDQKPKSETKSETKKSGTNRGKLQTPAQAYTAASGSKSYPKHRKNSKKSWLDRAWGR